MSMLSHFTAGTQFVISPLDNLFDEGFLPLVVD